MDDFDESKIETWTEWFEEIWGVTLHPKALELMDELILWDGNSGFMFGVDEDDGEFSVMTEEFKLNSNMSFFDLISERTISSGYDLNDFYIVDKSKILEIENLKKTEYGGYFIRIDYELIRYAIGQLMLQGYIESRMKEVSLFSIYRQTLPEFSKQHLNNIYQKLKTIIETAPSLNKTV